MSDEIIFDNNHILKIKSQYYEKYYSLKKNLYDIYPNLRGFITVSKLKGIGKTYSIWNEIIIPTINKEKLGSIIIGWSKTEIETMVNNLKENDNELVNKLNIETEFTINQNIKILRDKNTKQPLLFFIYPSQFKIMKKISIQNILLLKHVYWDEFLVPDNIYRKPEEMLDSYFQMLGSIFRTNDFFQGFTANNVNPDNPFLGHIFTEMGGPNYGESIIDTKAGVIIDSPIMNNKIKEMYENTTFFKITKVKPSIHEQLFGKNLQLYDNMYTNMNLLRYRIEEKCYYKFSYKIKTIQYNVLTFQNDITKKGNLYITPQKLLQKASYAGDPITALETNMQIIPSHLINSLYYYIKAEKLYFRDKKTLDLFIFMMKINKKDDGINIDGIKK